MLPRDRGLPDSPPAVMRAKLATAVDQTVDRDRRKIARNDLAPTIRAGQGWRVAGAPEGIRTPNLLIRSQMLYPLSYGRVLVNLYLDPTRTDRGRPSGVSGGSGI